MIYVIVSVAVRVLTVNSYAVTLTRPTYLLFLSLTDYNNFRNLNCCGGKLIAISVSTNAIRPPINERTHSDPSA